MNALTSHRHNSFMAVFNSLMNKFRENQDEAAFIPSSIDDTHGLGPLRQQITVRVSEMYLM